ncbi:MAG: hypothetical protein IKI23_01450 [Lachnospiraceae bacterium]|nr:hypothetical protein [Lachnospiraceae bacterium]
MLQDVILIIGLIAVGILGLCCIGIIFRVLTRKKNSGQFRTSRTGRSERDGKD